MTSIDHFDLRNFDLNLLVAFDALMEERSVTRAAARLRVQQPAMSHRLSTLRVLLGDALFVRVGPAMRPTPRALALAPRVRDALGRVQDALRQPAHFDPRTEERTFRLGFSSELELLVLPGLTARLRQCAPGVRLLGRPARRADVHRLLDDGALDLAVGCFDHGASRHRAVRLYDQSLSCCFHPGLLDVAAPVDVATYVRTSHALVTLRDGLQDDLQGCLTEALARIGTTLNVVVAASDFLTVLAAAAAAPVLATLPTRMARRYAPSFGLVVSPVPLDFQVPAVSMVWSARSDRDPGAAWLRDEVAAVLAREAA